MFSDLPKSLVTVFSADIMAAWADPGVRDSLVDTTLVLPTVPTVYTCVSPGEIKLDESLCLHIMSHCNIFHYFSAQG